MRRIKLFLALAVISFAALLAVAITGYVVLSAPTPSNQHPSEWMGQMWGGMNNMMGGNNVVQTQNPVAPYFGAIFISLVAIVAASVAGMVYFVAYPEIRAVKTATEAHDSNGTTPVFSPQSSEKASDQTRAFDAVLKTLTADERKVIETLVTHDGKYLQKYIRKEAGLSRLQTHRIVARLAERGILTAEKTGNTNAIMLANWLR